MFFAVYSLACLVHLPHLWFQQASRAPCVLGCQRCEGPSLCGSLSFTHNHRASFSFFEPTHTTQHSSSLFEPIRTNHAQHSSSLFEPIRTTHTQHSSSLFLLKINLAQDFVGFLHFLRESVEPGQSARRLRPPQVQHILNYKACHSAIRQARRRRACIVFGAASVCVFDGVRELSIMRRLRCA